MKATAAVAAVLACAAAASAAPSAIVSPLEYGADEVEAKPEGVQAMAILLNSRASASAWRYASAAAAVAADARRGGKMQRFLLATVASQSKSRAAMPRSARLDEKTVAGYLADSRAYVVELAEKKFNATAWYMLALESDDLAKLERAAALGSAPAMNALGTIVAADEPERARRLFERAAQGGDANGLYNLGSCLVDGIGGAKDAAKALECFVRAADGGHPEAMNNLGRFHREGIATRRDAAKAAEWFAKAAAAGSATGQLNYAMALLSGEGVEKDARRGVALLETAARNGSVLAMELLAKCYGEGAFGVEADAKLGVLWLVRSRAAKGDASAAKWLEDNGEASK